MQVLHFLITAQYSILMNEVINYLVDRGHLVSVINPQWLRKRDNFNLKLVDLANLNLSKFNYIIDIDFIIQETHIPKINFTFQLIKDKVAFGVLLIQKQHIYDLACGSLPLTSIRVENISQFYTEFTECFIDAVVNLLRHEEKIKQPVKVNFNNGFCDFLYLIKAFDELQNYYHGCKTEEETNFKLINMPFTIKNEIYQLFNINKVNLTSIQLEILVIYLQMLFNGRQAANYSYDFYQNGTLITKIISITATDSYQKLAHEINNKLYDLTNNQFYAIYSGNQGNSQVLLVNDDDFPTIEGKYGLILHYKKKPKCLQINYSSSLYFFADLKKLINYFRQKISHWQPNNLNMQELLYTELSLYSKQLYQWNATYKSYPQHKTIHQLFEEQVKNTPNNIALVYKEKQLTYSQLNAKANQLSHYLLNKYKPKGDDLIALCLDRSEYMLIGILGVLKAGAAYVPIDPSYPKERIAYILDDTQAQILITNKSHYNLMCQIALGEANLTTTKQNNKLSQTAIVVIDSPRQTPLANYAKTNPMLSTLSTNLAYVIYTSGTTGKPKGVMIEHKSIVNLVKAKSAACNIKKLNRSNNFPLASILYANYIFDAHVWQTFTIILNGHILHILPEEVRKNLILLTQYIKDNNILVGDIPTALLDVDTLLPLKTLVIGGDKARQEVLNQYLQNGVKVINCYGPSEVTVCATLHHYQSGDIYSNIGKAIQNVSLYVLDTYLKPMPVGVIGELYIGGIGLARGYLNQPQLTHERFLPNPFQTIKEKVQGINDRLYKTGDLVRYLPDGNIEYIGRNDFQVKIHGYRIELGEIENKLASYPKVKQAVVLVKSKQDNNALSHENHTSKYLVAYYVAQHKLDEAAIIIYLKNYLAEYMIPNAIIHLQSLPLTATGKLDRKALPEPEFTNVDNYVAPCGELEKQLVQIFSHVLKIDAHKISLKDSFFKLGGDSISAIKLIYEINRKLNQNVEIKALYSYSTVEAIIKLFNATSFIYTDYQIKQKDHADLFAPFSLSNVQQVYLLGREANLVLGRVATHAYSEAMYQQINKDRLELAINLLIKRHVILKSKFTQAMQQAILADDIHYQVAFYNCATVEDLNNIRNLMLGEVIPLTQVPLFNIAVSFLSYVNQYVVHFSFDALLLDIESIKIFLKELHLYYQDPTLCLPNLEITFKDYRNQYDKIMQSNLFAKAQTYWINKLDAYNFDMQLPLLMDSAKVVKPKFNRISKTIDKKVWQTIKEKAQQHQIGLTTIVLMAYGRVFTYWTNQKNICINLTLFNRLPLHERINDILGDFTILELFNYADDFNNTLLENLKLIHNELWNDIENSLFDGVNFLRLARSANNIPIDRLIAPIVLTSILGEEINWHPKFDGQNAVSLFFTAQTPQVWIDNKAYETEAGLIAEWDYVEQLFAPELIEKMHSHYCYIFEYLAQVNWEQAKVPQLKLPIQDYKIIDKANLACRPIIKQTLFGYYETFITNHHYLNNIAVIDNSANLPQSYSYRQLITDSNFLAQYIIKQSRRTLPLTNQLIGILAEKGYAQVVSSLGIMKAGYGYLPLNVDWPAGRIEEVLVQGKIKLLLLNRELYFKLKDKNFWLSNYEIIIIEDILALDNKLAQGANTSLNLPNLPGVSSNDIAYVIFTSGSTGKPKGVTISHQGALNTILAVNEKYKVCYTDKVLALSELSFDLSVYDIFGMLACGGTIVFPQQSRTKEPSHWIDLINKHKITIWNSVPQLADLLVKESEQSFSSINLLRLVLLSGDWISLSLPTKLKKNNPKAQIVSLGGATEGSIWSIWYDIDKVLDTWNSIPYGIAMPNQKMYVLNQYKEHCPIGVNGEIHIGGIGLALNYWQDKNKTRKSYFKHPRLGRLYKTGDLGKWHHDGYINFQGRKDNQVKINGYRIELGEIEHKLANLPGVADAIVTMQKIEQKNYLIGYLIAMDKNQADTKTQQIFKLAGYETQTNLKDGYKLSISLDKNKFCQRKSYRSFNTNKVNKQIIITQLKLAKANLKKMLARKGNNSLNLNILSELFTPLSCLQLTKRILPKFLYPSAGNSYAIRCYLNLGEELIANQGSSTLNTSLNKGYYYFNPLEQSLFKTTTFKFTNHNLTNYTTLDLRVNWQAIAPLYKNQSFRFVTLEVGHMLNLIVKQLIKLNISYSIIYYSNKTLDDENNLIAQIILGTAANQALKNTDLVTKAINNQVMTGNWLNWQLATMIDIYSKEQDSYLSFKQGKYINLRQLSIFEQANPYSGRILENGNCLISLNGEETVSNLILAGMLFQELSDNLYCYDYGSCMLGSSLTAKTLYLMVIGEISKTDKQSVESNATNIPLQEYIEYYLAKDLPEYMLPFTYMVIKEKPLNSNGKLAINQLPKPEIVINQEYIAPRTKLEQKIALLFAEALELKADKIGIKDDFFKLGGNSLLAMNLMLKINNELGKIKLQDIYANSTLEELACLISSRQNIKSEKVLSYAEFRRTSKN